MDALVVWDLWEDGGEREEDSRSNATMGEEEFRNEFREGT